MKKNKNIARIAAVQWEQKPFPALSDFLAEANDKLRIAAAYGADFVLFPEHWSWSIQSVCRFETPNEALRHLASLTEKIVEEISIKSRQLGLRIVAGTLPMERDGQLFNACFGCWPDRTEPLVYEKLHLTPWEKAAGFSAGDRLAVWDSPFGPVAPAICYDVEFPESVRLAALQGARLFFVPFQTDNEPGYWRVRHCSAARAIENEAFVVLAGSAGCPLGNPIMDTNWSQSCALSPSDLWFAQRGAVRAAQPNLPEMLIVDLDFGLLDRLKNEGAVRTLADRRTDVYRLSQ